MATTPIEKIMRILEGGLVGLIGAEVATATIHSIFNNESFLEALTKQETIYFAGAYALASALYQATEELRMLKNY